MKINIVPFGKGFNQIVNTYRNKVAFIDFDTKKSFNYNEIDILIKRCLCFLQKSGLKKNDTFLPALTNIAILYDTIGEYDKAIYFYRQAIQQDSRVAKRMSWFKRFLKNIHFKPSTIEERLAYLEKQLSFKNNKKRLHNEQIDNLQPDYQM